MKIKINIAIFLFNINTFLFLSESSSNIIRFAFILTRTGAHSPSKLKQMNSNDSKNIIYKDIFGYEWIGENELTSVGKRQQYYLGNRNNLRYKNILYSDIYCPKEISSISSDTNKTIQSSYAYLHGLYPSNNITLTDQQIINAIPPLNTDNGYIDAKNELDINNYILPDNIQIAPVLNFYEKDYNYLLEKIENCPNIKNYYDESELLSKKKLEEILYYKSEYNDKTYGEILVEILNEEQIYNENYNINIIKNNFTLFKQIAETFICDYFEAVNLDKFTEKGINIYKLLEMFEDFFGTISIGGGVNDLDGKRKNKTYELCQKVNYYLFNSLLNWIKLKIDNDIKKDFDILLYESPKIVSFFSHHESIESLYYFLKETFDIKNAKKSLYVNFTSFISIELYRKNNDNNEYTYNDFYIRFIYDNEQLGNDISYNKFYDKISEKIITLDELEEYCGLNQKENNNIIHNTETESESNIILKVFGILLICIFPILLSFVIFLIYKLKKNNFINLPDEIIPEN